MVHNSDQIPFYNPTDSSGTQGISSDSGNLLAADAKEVSRLAYILAEATTKNGVLIDKVLECLGLAKELTEAEAPFSDEIMASIKLIPASVESIARQLQETSGAAVVVASQSLNQMVLNVQKQVARMAVARVSSDDENGETEGSPP